jgi:hypothetical protein
MSLHYDEKGKFFTDYVSKDSVQAIIQTTTHRIEGLIYVRTGERVSDFLNTGGPFLAVTDATISDLSGVEVLSADFLSVNQNHVIWLTPKDEKSRQDEPADFHP